MPEMLSEAKHQGSPLVNRPLHEQREGTIDSSLRSECPKP
jgi:hypothetical protein